MADETCPTVRHPTLAADFADLLAMHGFDDNDDRHELIDTLLIAVESDKETPDDR